VACRVPRFDDAGGPRREQTRSIDDDLEDRLHKEVSVLTDALNEQVRIANAAVEARDEAKAGHAALVREFAALKSRTKLKPDAFLADPQTIDLGKKIASAGEQREQAEAKARVELAEHDRCRAAYDAKMKEFEDSGLATKIAHLTGRFGLRELN
jgi:hypothetical protein